MKKSSFASKRGQLMCDVMDCSVDLSRTKNKEDKKKGKDSWQRLGNK
jgi:hypothetical protein